MDKMKIYSILIMLLSVVIYGSAAGSSVYEPEKLRVHLRMDKKIYYSDEEIILSICVKNVSDEKNYFFVYDPMNKETSHYTTFQPMVYDMSGREVEISVSYKIENRNINDLLKELDKRMIELAPRETFVYTVNLKELFAMKQNTVYRIQSHFYPTFEENQIIKSNNELTFKIIDTKRYNKLTEVNARERFISPKEVILLTLKAEKDRDWDNCIKYINIEKYINAFPEFTQKYFRANFEEKTEVEKEFIKFLTRDRDDYIYNYTILREEIESDSTIAYVDVVIDRSGHRWTNRYKCRYTLEQYKNLWLITDQEATVMKGVEQ